MRSQTTPFTVMTVAVALLFSACQSKNASPTTIPTDSQIITIQTLSSESHRSSATIQVNSPSNMTVADGLLWVISGSSILQIDPKTNQILGKPISPGVQAEDIAVHDNTLWVTSVGPGDLGAPSDIDAVSAIDPESGEILATIKVARAPMSLVAILEGIWVVNFGGNGDTVIRIDPETHQIAGEPIETGRAPICLAVGDGSIWVANHDAHTVTRIDPATHHVIANITVSSEPHRIAYGEGTLWVANWHEDSVTRIDPQTNQVVGEPIPIGHPAGNIAVGFGSVWVTSDYRGPVDGAPEDVVLVRIDPQTNQAVESIALGGHPIDVEVSEDAVWISVQGPNMVLKITP
jgi:YVTN family beta-propeller protein